MRSYLEDQLAKPGKKFLLAGETHSLFDHSLIALITALREIKDLHSTTIILICESLSQICAEAKNQPYTVEHLRDRLKDQDELKLMEEFIQLGVQVYGAENEFTNFIHQPQATSKEELYQRLVKSELYSKTQLSLLADIVEDQDRILIDLEMAAGSAYEKMDARLVRANETFTSCMVQATHECKNENVLCIFSGGVSHLPSASRTGTIVEPGMLARVLAEYKKISSGEEATAAACYIATPIIKPADSYIPQSENGVKFAAVSPVFLAPLPPAFLKNQGLFALVQQIQQEQKPKSSRSCVIL